MLSDEIKYLLIEKYRKLSEFWLVADGTSMLPNISPKDKLYIKKQDDYFIGEVIAFVNPRTYMDNIIVVHRIINKNKHRYYTKGDNQIECDPPVRRSNVLGKVLKISKHNEKGAKSASIYN